MLERIFNGCARFWRYLMSHQIVRFGVTGGVSTAAGFTLITLLIKQWGVEQNLANFAQATALFMLLFLPYRHWVFRTGLSGTKTAAGRWFITKMTGTFMVTPGIFFCLSLTGGPYWWNYFGAAASSGLYSYAAGHWAFGIRKQPAE